MDFKSESIIVSAVRTFCRSFAAIIGIMLGVILVFFALMMFSTPDIFPPKSTLVISADASGNRDLLPQNTPVILRLDITGVIGQGDLTAAKIQNALFDSREGMLSHNRVKGVLLFTRPCSIIKKNIKCLFTPTSRVCALQGECISPVQRIKFLLPRPVSLALSV
jgi:hypothetical protein